MRSPTQKRKLVKPPVVGPGNWQGEILDGYTVSLGQVVQDGPPRQSVEFSYIVTPAIFTSPDAQFARPGILMFAQPAAKASMKTMVSRAPRLLAE
jgi:hypothetical protein